MGSYDDQVWFDEYGKPFEPTERSELEQARPETVLDRHIDLMPFLNGTYVPPQPSVGGERDAGAARLLYPGRWHTLIAPTEVGKSWWALWHMVSEIRAGHTVVYAHFEEFSPAGTLDRLRAVAPELTAEQITKQFVWLDCSYRWTREQWQLALPSEPRLVVLDGINAACGQHGWLVDKTEAVGEYRSLFVYPAARRGAAILSLGHPPKSPDRQFERHGFGSTAWLDEVDGVGFRMKPSERAPIRRDLHGFASIYVVKDRYGQVKALGRQETGGQSEGWYYVGALHVDATEEHTNTVLFMSSPQPEMAALPDELTDIDRLSLSIVDHLMGVSDHRFDRLATLRDQLRAAGVRFKAADLNPSLIMLETRGLLDWPIAPMRAPRPGVLTDLAIEGWQRRNAPDDEERDDRDPP